MWLFTSQQFWIGIVIGLFAGGIFGVVIMAIMAMAKDDEPTPHADDIVDLNHNDATIAPRWPADRFYREPDDGKYRR